MPKPVAIWMNADMPARWLMGKRSPSSEKTKGKTPPMAMPVSMRRMRNCQYAVTCAQNWGRRNRMGGDNAQDEELPVASDLCAKELEEEKHDVWCGGGKGCSGPGAANGL